MRLHQAMLLAGGLFSLSCTDTPTRPPSMAALGALDPSNVTVVDPAFRSIGIGAGNEHSCAVTGGLALRCWGSNANSQAPQHHGPPDDSPYVQVSAGTGNNTCALRLDFAIECFGKNDIGQSPGIVTATESFFVQVDAGRDHACALRADQVLECLGGSEETPYDYAPPFATAIVGGFVQVSAGDETTCALRSDGQIECGGVEGGDIFSIAPRRFTRMSAGKHFVCAIHGDATKISCRGENGAGQAPVTRTAGGGSRYVDVTAGDLHACALRRDHVAECWGDNSDGQAPATIERFTQISAGAFHTCGVRPEGKTECWGWNGAGQTDVPSVPELFRFKGFRSPHVTNPVPGALNHVVLYSGGGNMQLKFSLGSNEGLDVIAPGYPQVAPINCAAPEVLDNGTPTTGSLVYSPGENTYTYRWSMPGSLTASCRQFIMKLTDNTYHRVNFRFTGPPAAIIKISGGAPSTIAGTVVPTIGLRLVDEFGFGIAVREMIFAVMQGGGSVAAASRTTDPLGFIEVPAWTTGSFGPQQLRATVVAQSGTFNFDMATNAVLGSAAKLAFAVQPANVAAYDTVGPAVTVVVQDAGGNVVPSATNSIQLTFDANPGSAVLGGTLNQEAVAGSTAWSDLSVNAPGAGYRLKATAEGLASSVSAPFNAYVFSSPAAGNDGACALRSDSLAFCWRNGGSEMHQPILMSGSIRFTSLSYGRNWRCGLAGEGELYCWNGFNGPERKLASLTVKQVSNGSTHTCLLTTTNDVYCWGQGYADVGPDDAVQVTTPVPFASITAGNQHTCGLSATGAAYCWGAAGTGLGVGDGLERTSPTAVTGGLTFASLTAAGLHTCGLLGNGTAYCWGDNENVGLLGNGSASGSAHAPALVDGGLTFATLSSATSHTCGLTLAGAAYCWGLNARGELGIGTMDDLAHPSPEAVVGGHTFVQLSVGGDIVSGSSSLWGTACGIDEKGRIIFWGAHNTGGTPIRIKQ